MEITVRKTESGAYSLRFDDAEFTLAEGDLKRLVLQITKLFSPGAPFEKSAEERTREFVGRITEVDDVAIQKLLLLADHGDILVLLKAAENDEMLLDKLYRNMSERSRKIFLEDLEYKYKDEVPAGEVATAIMRLEGTVRKLEEEAAPAREKAAES